MSRGRAKPALKKATTTQLHTSITAALKRIAGGLRSKSIAPAVFRNWEYRLPTEAQWEYACRAGTTTKYSFGDDASKLGDYAWFVDNAKNTDEAYAREVGQKLPNAWNLHDMHGNLWEWCVDWYQSDLPGGRDPEVAEEGSSSARVDRGGSWRVSAEVCESAYRDFSSPDFRYFNLGFRVAAVQRGE